MTKKRNPAKRSKSKSKSKSRKPSRKRAIPAVKILDVNLPPDAGVRVGVAPGRPMPVIIADPVKREVVLLPVERKKGFWETIFG